MSDETLEINVRTENLENERDRIAAEIRDLERRVYDLEAKKRDIEWELAVYNTH